MKNKDLRADREIVLAAVSDDGDALRYASKKLRADKEVVLVAIKNAYFAFEYVSEELRADKEVVLEAVKNNGDSLEHASEKLRADKEVVLAAVSTKKGCYDALQYASEELRADKEVVLAAVKNYGDVLQYASEELRADKEVVLAAVKNYGDALQYASEELKADREIVLEAVKNYGYALQYVKEMEPIRIDVSRHHWQIPSPGNVLSGYLEGIPSDEEIRQLEEDALKRRAEWKPSEKALALVEQLKVFIGRRIKIQFWNSMMMYDEDEAPTPLEADCEDVVILNIVDRRGDVFPQAYLVIDNIKDREARSSYLTRRESIVDPIANDIVGDFASITGICEVWTVE